MVEGNITVKGNEKGADKYLKRMKEELDDSDTGVCILPGCGVRFKAGGSGGKKYCCSEHQRKGWSLKNPDKVKVYRMKYNVKKLLEKDGLVLAKNDKKIVGGKVEIPKELLADIPAEIIKKWVLEGKI